MMFEPWIGNKYETEGLRGVRVLALGESHYAAPGLASSTFTSEVVKEWVFHRRKAYFTKVAKLLLGMGAGVYLPNVELQDTWSRIAFYNYVQQMLPCPRVRPTEDMWHEAQNLFPAVVCSLRPQLIVVMGKNLGDWFVAPDGIEICYTAHPSSSRFTYERGVEDIRAAYARVAANHSLQARRP